MRGVELPEPGVRAVAALADDLRRALYRFVRTQRRPTTRDEAAAATGVSRKLAAFHLDKLVDAGLLRARSDISPGRPRGRPPKVYEPAETAVAVTIPPQRYDLLGEILLDTVAAATADGDHGDEVRAAALRVARQRGEEYGEVARAERGLHRVGAERALSTACAVLAGLGFEPDPTPRRVTLTNCPFHRLAERQRDLVCGINREFCDGLLRGLGNETAKAVLAPAEGRCCVELRA